MAAPRDRDWADIRPTPVAGASLLRAHFVRHQFDRHSHDTWSIGVTFEGHQSFRCRGTQATSRRGNVIVFRPGDAHDGHAEDELGFRYAMLYIDESRVDEWLGRRHPISGCRPGAGRGPISFDKALIHDPALAQRLAVAVDACLQPKESMRAEATLRDSVVSLFERHGRHRTERMRTTGDAPWLRRVRDYMEAHHASDLKVGNLAQLADVSRVHLTRVFQQAYGMPPHVHLNDLRLRAAMRLMLAGRGLAAVATEAGFADQSHFTRRFKGAFGVTPTAWLREHRRP